eukprot:384320_1
MSTEEKQHGYNTFPPNSINDLIYWMKKLHLPKTYIDKFADRLAFWDWVDITEDINNMAIIFDFCKDQLKAEHIYYLVKDIIHGNVNKNTIDCHLTMYCKNDGRNDYYDENNKSKLAMFLNNNGLDLDTMIAELNDEMNPKECKLIELCMDDYGYYPNEMYYVLKFCFKHKKIPKQITMDNLMENMSSNERILNWERISNAIDHELYERISYELMQILYSCKYKTVNAILNKLKNKMKIGDIEIKYINRLIKRAIKFFYPSKGNMYQPVTDFSADVQLLYDVYNVHNCFLFMKFNFQQYESTSFIQDTKRCKILNETDILKITCQEIEAIKFNLFSSFIIDDDMYSICNYFFAISHLINKIRQSHN